MAASFVLAIVGLVLLLAIVLELVRKRLLRERFALAWIVSISTLVLVAVVPGLLDSLAYLVGIRYPPTLLLILSVALLAILVLGIATQLSAIDERLQAVAQHMALQEVDGVAAAEENDRPLPPDAAADVRHAE